MLFVQFFIYLCGCWLKIYIITDTVQSDSIQCSKTSKSLTSASFLRLCSSHCKCGGAPTLPRFFYPSLKIGPSETVNPANQLLYPNWKTLQIIMCHKNIKSLCKCVEKLHCRIYIYMFLENVQPSAVTSCN